MSARILIVEDEMLVAADMEATIEDLGHVCTGIAPDLQAATALAAADPDIALVDLNLRDGATGAEIGAMLSRRGIAVIFVTANPRMLGNGVPGTLGVITKPCDEAAVDQVIAYAIGCRKGERLVPPEGFRTFSPSA
ncbi:Phyllosphere-induced regulator PhyR [Methylobacterium organophilum]|uniref:Phyllosphere-induced regulator PhyR n=1 Tax=Methylobacterium organophilum TaxID=410 RepID=A0ABQ4T7Y0_METOR|nr:response regulator [Methylobacterium organophilum]UMY15532.1 response regulator [Methylobacterium organophilum]GJE27751.1 Phyllosphere-induced regulator PhyR [Methylobacterium organophilum]